MRFTPLLATIAVVASTVSALPGTETNGQRLARGLPPLPPVIRASGTEFAKRGQPSGSPGQCPTGPAQCCKSIGHITDGPVGLLLKLLGVVVQDLNALIGLTCSPITIIGSGSGSCSSQPVCCKDNSYKGVIAVGCTPA